MRGKYECFLPPGRPSDAGKDVVDVGVVCFSGDNRIETVSQGGFRGREKYPVNFVERFQAFLFSAVRIEGGDTGVPSPYVSESPLLKEGVRLVSAAAVRLCIG